MEYHLITEKWGLEMPRHQRQMVYRRYDFALAASPLDPIVDVGAGQGLGLSLCGTRPTVAGDIDPVNLVAIAEHHPDRPALRLDAQRLPFAADSVGTVLAFEMLYYLAEQGRFFRECRRVLKPGGAVVIAVANPERAGFHRSPYSTDYPSASMLRSLLYAAGLDPAIFGLYREETTPKAKAMRMAFGTAERLHLVPRTLEGRNKIKRVLYGASPGFSGFDDGDRVDERSEPATEVRPGEAANEFRVLYAVGRKPDPTDASTSERTTQ